MKDHNTISLLSHGTMTIKVILFYLQGCYGTFVRFQTCFFFVYSIFLMVRIYLKQFLATGDAFQLWVFLANTQGRKFTVIVFSLSPLNDHVNTEGRTPRQCHKFRSPCISCATISGEPLKQKL